MPKLIDLDKLTPQELKNLLANSERLGRTDTASAVITEMASRGLATSREYRVLQWNQERVRGIMKPFKEIASAVVENERTSYTEAGGRKIGRPKDDPEHLWIDSYCAIKTPRINASFACHISHPGDEPEFQMRTDGETVRVYNADQLADAFGEWQCIARIAVAAETMLARPVKGEIDYTELSREHLARYPKIRAALAK